MAEHQSMAQGESSPSPSASRRVLSFSAYRHEWLRHDVTAGLSVAAVAIPVGVAYAQLAGFKPVVGLYASILPLGAYALFGTSPQLIVGRCRHVRHGPCWPTGSPYSSSARRLAAASLEMNTVSGARHNITSKTRNTPTNSFNDWTGTP